MPLRPLALAALLPLSLLHAQDTQAARQKEAERYVQNLPAKDFQAEVKTAFEKAEQERGEHT